jgi:8-oxo-dGTP diphosphatase
MTIYAAGVICWREQKGELEVLLVHREKYKDWSFPKGKQDPGEMLPETAVREMEEETGVRLKLGRKLSVMKYQVPSGEDKEVHYWASKLKPKAWKEAKFKPNDEIAKLDWVTADKAKKSLSYEHDKDLLGELVQLWKNQELETRALILLRHAKATPRSDWSGEEAKRPLLPEGKKQSKRLVRLLGAYSPKRLVTSPWARCHQTVEPYAKSCKRTLISRSQLTELSNALSPRKTIHAVEALFDETKSALICSHRPALPTITETLATRAEEGIREQILDAKTLQPAEFVVLRLSMGKKPKFVALERVMLDS